MRRAFPLWLAAALALAPVECLLLPRLWPGTAWPSLTFLLAVAVTMRAADRRHEGDADLMALCFAMGLIKDLFTCGPVGGNAFVFTTAAAALTGFRRMFYLWTPLLWAPAGFVVFAGGHLIEGLAVGAVGGARLAATSLAAATAETALLPVALGTFRRMKVALRGS